MSRDPIGFGGGDWNLYGYVGNDPLLGVDASGMYNSPSQNQNFTDCFWNNIRYYPYKTSYYDCLMCASKYHIPNKKCDKLEPARPPDPKVISLLYFLFVTLNGECEPYSSYINAQSCCDSISQQLGSVPFFANIFCDITCAAILTCSSACTKAMRNEDGISIGYQDVINGFKACILSLRPHLGKKDWLKLFFDIVDKID